MLEPSVIEYHDCTHTSPPTGQRIAHCTYIRLDETRCRNAWDAEIAGPPRQVRYEMTRAAIDKARSATDATT